MILIIYHYYNQDQGHIDINIPCSHWNLFLLFLFAKVNNLGTKFMYSVVYNFIPTPTTKHPAALTKHFLK